MIIETVIASKALWSFDLRSLNPRGRNLNPALASKLTQWYGFQAPTEFDYEKGVTFTGGEFSPTERGDDFTGIELTIYNTGALATTCTSTDDADRFIELAYARLAKEDLLAFRPEIIKRKQYSSELIARSIGQLQIPKLDPVYALISQLIYNGKADLSFNTLWLDSDQISTQWKQGPFKFERRAGVSFRDNLWYSHGPFSTQQHQQVLDEIERALSI